MGYVAISGSERSMTDQISALAELFKGGTTAVLTGAGISTDSGIPDYRGADSVQRDPMSMQQFTRDPHYRKRFWAGARVGQNHTRRIRPNDGHLALAKLEQAGFIDGVITQNVDGLHARAGSKKVVEMHGAGNTIRCMTCGSTWPRQQVLEWFDQLNPEFARDNAGARMAPDGDALVGDTASVQVPNCPSCGGMLRPTVVYFGETVPAPVFEQACELVDDADALLVAGSSLAVNTGIRLVQRAERRAIPIAVINRGPTAIDSRPSTALRIEGGTTETLVRLTEELKL